MKKISLFFIFIIMMLTKTVYSQIPPINQSYQHQKSLDTMEKIRGYAFGERISFILAEEEKKKELALVTSLTNLNRIVYEGLLFDENMRVTFLFRENRLTSLSYLWLMDDSNSYFSNKIHTLLEIKYSKPTNKKIPSSDGSILVETYYRTEILTNDQSKISTNTNLIIQLETITQTNQSYNKIITGYILEFLPIDADQIINKKILTEDL
ncbi:MAG: hypothetical protein ACRCVW_06940 [Brevinema sp.]